MECLRQLVLLLSINEWRKSDLEKFGNHRGSNIYTIDIDVKAVKIKNLTQEAFVDKGSLWLS